jgi:hypothetical protein
MAMLSLLALLLEYYAEALARFRAAMYKYFFKIRKSDKQINFLLQVFR